MSRIENKVYRLRNYHEFQIPGYVGNLKFNGGEEFHIINDVVYMGGFPVSNSINKAIFNWIKGNPNLFIDDTRKF